MRLRCLAATLGAALGMALAVQGCAPVAAVGATAVVARSVAQERTTGDALDDNKIAFSLNRRLLEQSTTLFTAVTVDVTEGRVVLIGSVPEQADRDTAVRLAWATPGVVSVEDQLTVGGNTGVGPYFVDARISNELRSKLLADGQVASQNYSVETVDRVVQLTGLARSPEELQRVIDHASAVPGVERVVSHVLTIDDPRRVTAPPEPSAAG